METWRLITDGPAEGSWNMAVDEALLYLAQAGARTPILRFYSWSQPTLTIGRLQKTGDGLNLGHIAAMGIPVVRRVTGGRALLHWREVTYSMVIPSSSAAFGSMRQVYSLAAGAIGRALGEMGVAVDRPMDGDGGYALSSACLATRTGFEISAGGRKVAACAQRRLKNAVMQHGSIFLSIPWDLHLNCFLWRDEDERKKTAGGMAGLEEMAPGISAEALTRRITAAFEETVSIRLEPSSLDGAEGAAAEEAAARIKTGQASLPSAVS